MTPSVGNVENDTDSVAEGQVLNPRLQKDLACELMPGYKKCSF